MRLRVVSVGLLAAVLGAGCSGANPSSGQTATMQIQKAQFIAGAIDTTTYGKLPEVHSISTQNNELFPGVSGKAFSGTAGPGSAAILIGLVGDVGHWVVPVQDEDPITPGDFIYGCTASFSVSMSAVEAGGLTLVVRATDKLGNMGPAVLQPLTLESPRVDGTLVISLDWDTEADLDLHVALPSADAGVNEIWSRKPSGLPVGSQSATVQQGMASGYLDFDSNGQCVIDGRRMENVVFPASAPSGEYAVRVDSFSLCGQPTARWRVQVFTQGASAPLLQAYGQSTETDTRFPHGQGAGAFALVFNYNQ